MPLTSRPRIAGNDNGKFFCRIPERSFQSIGLTLAAVAAIRTVLPLICGSGTLSSNFSFSGPPYSCSTTAFIVYLLPAELQAYICGDHTPPQALFERSLSNSCRLWSGYDRIRHAHQILRSATVP